MTWWRVKMLNGWLWSLTIRNHQMMIGLEYFRLLNLSKFSIVLSNSISIKSKYLILNKMFKWYSASTCYDENDSKQQGPYICSAPIKVSRVSVFIILYHMIIKNIDFILLLCFHSTHLQITQIRDMKKLGKVHWNSR